MGAQELALPEFSNCQYATTLHATTLRVLTFLGITAAKIVAAFVWPLGCHLRGIVFLASVILLIEIWLDTSRSLHVNFPQFFTDYMASFTWTFLMVKVFFPWFFSLMSSKVYEIKFLSSRFRL
jgi:hypothetical protein